MPAGPATTRHSAEDIVDAALEILATHGLPGLSMRRIADTLDLQPSALYWHFPNKQSLLAAVSDRILAPLDEAAPGDFGQVAEDFRDALLAHRDGAELVYSSFALGLSRMPALSMFEDAAQRAGADPGHAGTAARTGVHYVLGFVFFEQQQEFAAHVGVMQHPGTDRDEEFAAGVALLRAGLGEHRRPLQPS